MMEFLMGLSKEFCSFFALSIVWYHSKKTIRGICVPVTTADLLARKTYNRLFAFEAETLVAVHLVDEVSGHDDSLVGGEHDAFDRVNGGVVGLAGEDLDDLGNALHGVVVQPEED